MDEGAPCAKAMDDEIEFIRKIWGAGHSIAPSVEEAVHMGRRNPCSQTMGSWSAEKNKKIILRQKKTNRTHWLL
jgi:hypothetical protein